MKILTRYIIKEITAPLFFGLFAFTSMLMGFLLIDLMKDAADYHLSIWSIIKLMSLRAPEYIMNAAPIAVLLAALLGLGTLTGHSETIAMRAGGLSYFRLAAPVLIVGLMVSLGSIALNEYLVPVSLRVYDRTKAELFSSQSGVRVEDFKKTLWDGPVKKEISADLYEQNTQTLHRVVILEKEKGQVLRLIEVKTMYWDGHGWFFENGRINQFTDEVTYPVVIRKAKTHFPLELTPTDIERSNEGPEKKSITEFYTAIQGAPKSKRHGLLVDFHLKMAMPFASLIFAIIGTPLALRPQRRSNAAAFGLCVLFIFIWYALMAGGTFLGRAGILPPFVGAWLPNIVLAGYGVYVFQQVKN